MGTGGDGPAGSSVYVGRLAPAPTGALHLGNARTFLLAWLRARRANGRLILRLEDLDHPKVKPGAAEQAYADLAWLGLDWDAGPAAARRHLPASAPPPPPAGADAGRADPFVQSDNADRYASLVRRLCGLGAVYPCVCRRKDLERVHSAPNAGEELFEARYPGTCRGRFADPDAARAAAGGRELGWRLRVDDGVSEFVDGFCGERRSRLADWSGDFLVARGGKAGYQLAVVADDAGMGVTEVVRGDDLLPSTHRQLAVYAALGLKPPAFFHVPLVVGRDGRRLAKRHGDSRLSALRTRGDGPERILGWLAWSCGWRKSYRSGATLDDIAGMADFGVLPRERTVVDAEMLRWLGFRL